jgi:hypothetical protein
MSNPDPQAQATGNAASLSAGDILGVSDTAQVERNVETSKPDTLTDTTDNQAQATGEAGQPGEQSLLAGKFKTVDELEKGYENLQSLLGRKGLLQLPGDEGKDKQPEVANVAPDSTQTLDLEKINESFKQSFEQNPLLTLQQLLQAQVSRIVAPIQEQVASQRLQAETMRLAAQHEDFVELSPRISEVLKKRPYLQQIVRVHPEAIEDAYRIAKSELAAEVAQAAKEAGRVEGQQAAKVKASAATAPVSSQQMPQEETPEDKILRGIFGISGEKQGMYDY